LDAARHTKGASSTGAMMITAYSLPMMKTQTDCYPGTKLPSRRGRPRLDPPRAYRPVAISSSFMEL
jgi:hypothetical protein